MGSHQQSIRKRGVRITSIVETTGARVYATVSAPYCGIEVKREASPTNHTRYVQVERVMVWTVYRHSSDSSVRCQTHFISGSAFVEDPCGGPSRGSGTQKSSSRRHEHITAKEHPAKTARLALGEGEN